VVRAPAREDNSRGFRLQFPDGLTGVRIRTCGDEVM